MNIQIKDCSDDQLNELYEQISKEMGSRNLSKELIEKKSLNINGITSKDFCVEYQDHYVEPGEKDYRPFFSFYIKRGKKKYCIYYDYNGEKPQKWWPVLDEENAAFQFIPPGFSEALENGYQFKGTEEEAIERLNQCGFIDIKNLQA